MTTAADLLARRAAEAAAAWLRDPRDRYAYDRMVTAVERYADWHEPPLDLQLAEQVINHAQHAAPGTAGDLLRGELRDTITRLARQTGAGQIAAEPDAASEVGAADHSRGDGMAGDSRRS